MFERFSRQNIAAGFLGGLIGSIAATAYGMSYPENNPFAIIEDHLQPVCEIKPDRSRSDVLDIIDTLQAQGREDVTDESKKLLGPDGEILETDDGGSATVAGFSRYDMQPGEILQINNVSEYACMQVYGTSVE